MKYLNGWKTDNTHIYTHASIQKEVNNISEKYQGGLLDESI